MTVNEVVADQVAGDKYNVTVNNVAALPNNTVIISGKITDVFGNPVKRSARRRSRSITSPSVPSARPEQQRDG